MEIMKQCLCRKVGKLFEYAAQQHCHEITFCKQFLTSKTCKRLLAMDETLVSQSYLYLWHDIEKEFPVSHNNETAFPDAMYWAGYLFMYWCFLEKISGKELINEYDIRWILENYEIFHTLSTRTAIREIKESGKITDQILEKAGIKK